MNTLTLAHTAWKGSVTRIADVPRHHRCLEPKQTIAWKRTALAMWTNDVGDPHGERKAPSLEVIGALVLSADMVESYIYWQELKTICPVAVLLAAPCYKMVNARPLHLEHLSEHFTLVLQQFKQGNTPWILKLIGKALINTEVCFCSLPCAAHSFCIVLASGAWLQKDKCKVVCQ